MYILELPILETVIKCVRLLISVRVFSSYISHSIRNRLTALKKDRAEYIKPSDVNSLYQAVVKQGLPCHTTLTPQTVSCFPVTKLNDIRDDTATYNNRLDTTLADVFNLLSLFFLTIGKTKVTPAVYSQIASMRVRFIPS